MNFRYIIVIFLLSVINWIAHFSLARGFGLYEDDYFFISRAIGWNLPRLWEEIINNFIKWPQGRPIGFSIPPLLSFVGFQLAGLYGVYIISFIILTMNSILVYMLIKRIYSSEFMAVIASLAFIVFPVDSTRSFLMHATGLQPSLTLLLIASIFYLSGRKIISYFIALGSLLTYETAFAVFLGIPLLSLKWDHKFIKELIQHLIISTILILCVVGIRLFLNDSRVYLGSEVFLILPKMVASLLIGPLVSLGIYFYALVAIILNYNGNVMIAIILSLVIINGFLFYSRKEFISIAHSDSVILTPKIMDLFGKIKIAPKHWKLAQLFLTACVLLCLGYLFSFTHFPPIQYHGRGTSVHFAASVGSSILFACLSTLVIDVTSQYRHKYIGITVMTIYLSLAVGYGVVIQEDFVKSWQSQQCFWTKALKVVPDLQDNTIIFFLKQSYTEPKYILPFSWADALMLSQIYIFPSEWKNPPRLFTIDSDLSNLTFLNNGQLEWNVPKATWPAHREVLPESNLILLQEENQSLKRIDGSITIKDQQITLKQITIENENSFIPGLLYEIIKIDNLANCVITR
jgi:hypothetical protein